MTAANVAAGTVSGEARALPAIDQQFTALRDQE
jgi:hypothetical protein